jgi:hypothetical protein
MSSVVPTGDSAARSDSGRRRRSGKPHRRRSGAAVLRYISTVVAVVAHGLAGFGVLVSGLVVPDWARLLFGLAWIAGAAAMYFLRRRPLLVVAVPVAMWALLFVGAFAGERWLGWTA